MILRILKSASLLALALALIAVPAALGQDEPSFDSTSSKIQADLEKSLRELSELRRLIADEKLPLSRELSGAEHQLVEARREFDEAARTLDTGNLELNNLRNAIKTRREEASYLSNLLDEYARNFESRLAIVELQRYDELVKDARNAPSNGELTPAEAYAEQLDLVEASMERLVAAVGGEKFQGRGVREDGKVADVTYAVFGPVALYGSEADGGLAETQIGSLEPRLAPYELPEHVDAVRALVGSGEGLLPLDPTLGNAKKIEMTQDTLWEHISKGGVVMVPILLLALASLIVALIKLAQMIKIKTPPGKLLTALYDAAGAKRYDEAREKAKAIGGPVGEMLDRGIDHAEEPRELIEEVMFEKTLETRLRLNSLLSFISICAASAPLLGLLGTVTGIINTFKLITIHGTGDAKVLSSGISEALITTEFGLIIAIPSLLLHAYLSRRARRVTENMEKSAVTFVNRISLANIRNEEEAA